MLESSPNGFFPTGSCILFGLGLGGLFDGIVLHQVLQWHHMVSSWYPPTTLENLRLNTLWDGIFHSTTYVFVVLALYAFWKAAHRRHIYWSGKLMWGALLLGWGLFNVVEGPARPRVARRAPRERAGCPRPARCMGHRLPRLGRPHGGRGRVVAESRQI